MAFGLGLGLTLRRPRGGRTYTPPAPSDALATPTLIEDTGGLSGDNRPLFDFNANALYPDGINFDDTVQFQWGLSEAAAAAMTPVGYVFEEAWVLDDVDPSPELVTFAKAQAPGAVVSYRIKGIGGAHRTGANIRSDSAWSNFLAYTIVDGVMDAPGLADLSNQAASSRVWSTSFNPTGMTVGAFARLTGTGPIERTRSGATVVFEAGDECAVLMTDDVRFGIDTDSVAGGVVDNTVSNRGVFLETFTATVAGSSVAAVPSTKMGEQFVSPSGTSVTSAGVDFQAGYAVVGLSTWEAPTRDITSVTIGGIAATRLDFSTASVDDCDWFYAPITAGSHSVVVNYSGTGVTTVTLTFFTVQNATFPPASLDALGPATRSGVETTGALTIGADGLGIALLRIPGASLPVSFTSGSEVARWTDSYGHVHILAKQTVSGQAIATNSLSGSSKMRYHAVFNKAP